MTRFLGAVAAFLGLSLASASAFFIEITVDLNHLDKIKGNNTQSGGMLGNAGGGQQLGGAGGLGGRGAAGGGGQNMGGIAGLGGRPNGGGMAGIAGSPNMAGGGGPSGAGMAGGRGMAGVAGFPNMAGGGGPSGAGISGGRGGMAGLAGGGGMAGNAGFGGLAGNAGVAGAQGNVIEIPVKEPPPSQIKVRIELKGIPRVDRINGKLIHMVEHKWGRSAIIASELIRVSSEKRIDPISAQYKKERTKALKEKDKGALLALARWVLRHGMVAEFPKIMDEVEKLAPGDMAVKAFKKIEEAMKAPLAGDDPAAAWIKSFSAGKYEAKKNPQFPHYTLITNSVLKDDIDNELKRLEDNYHTFFYWFTLQGKVLQVPKNRLIAVLLTEKDEFASYRAIFKNIPVESAGFTARRDNVPVMYAKRLDPLYVELDKENNKIWLSLNKQDLLKGTKRLPNSIEKANQEVLTLVQRVMEEETQLATATHEGIRQLMAVTGLPREGGSSLWTPMLARNLSGPEWARFGLASFFETPEGAYWPGAGAPSWKYLIKFKFLLEDNKLGDFGDVLEKVVTDQYFRDALASSDQEKMEIARATSWALAYYLAKGDDRGVHVDKLFNYLRGISKLPRDMELSKAALKKAFNHAFSLADRNAEKLFANNWLGFMRKLEFEVPGFWAEARKARADAIAAARGKDDRQNPQGVMPNFGPNRPNGPNGAPPTGPPMGFPKAPGGQRNPNGGR